MLAGAITRAAKAAIRHSFPLWEGVSRYFSAFVTAADGSILPFESLFFPPAQRHTMMLNDSAIVLFCQQRESTRAFLHRMPPAVYDIQRRVPQFHIFQHDQPLSGSHRRPPKHRTPWSPRRCQTHFQYARDAQRYRACQTAPSTPPPRPRRHY
jgi:hypothetical protein